MGIQGFIFKVFFYFRTQKTYYGSCIIFIRYHNRLVSIKRCTLVKKNKNNKIQKLKVAKENSYHGFERRDDDIRRDKDDKHLTALGLEKEEALARVKELETEKEALEIPINEHVLYYGSLFIGFFVQATWLLLLTIKG